ncbi:gamma carbonic anhydrase family protein, partial [Campylobacter jejuni]
MLIKFKNHSPKLGQNVFVAEGAKIIGEIEIGDESSIWFNCVLRADVNFIKIG